jgi:hypothetical protein
MRYIGAFAQSPAQDNLNDVGQWVNGAP